MIFSATPFYIFITEVHCIGPVSFSYKIHRPAESLVNIDIFLNNTYVNIFIFYLACNNFWIVNALSIDEAFVWASPFVALALPAYMATFTSVASWVLYLNRKRAPMIRASSFALTWSVMEVLRAYATFGFSMSAIGHSVAFSDSIAQTASILGVYGLSAALIFISVIPAEAALSHSVRKALVYSFSMCLVICSAYVWGARRLSLATPSYLKYTRHRYCFIFAQAIRITC